MITHPSAQEILQAVSQWIEDLRPRLDERDAFLARVTGHALATVARELTQGSSAETAAVSRMTQLLGHAGAYDTLSRELCEKLRTGQLDVTTPDLLAALRENTLDQLLIDQPSYKHRP